MARDCAGEEGCILSAIVNNTGIAADASVAREGRALALKWVVHFLGTSDGCLV